MIINPKQAEIVKYIFAEVLSGKGTQKVANDLNQKGINVKIILNNCANIFMYNCSIIFIRYFG